MKVRIREQAYVPGFWKVFSCPLPLLFFSKMKYRELECDSNDFLFSSQCLSSVPFGLLKATTPSRVAKEMVPLPPYQESHVFVHLKQ